MHGFFCQCFAQVWRTRKQRMCFQQIGIVQLVNLLNHLKSSKIRLKSKYQPKEKDPLWASAVLPTLLLPWWCEAPAPWSALSALSWEAAHPRMSDAEKNWLFQKVSVFQYHQAKSKVGKVGLSIFFKKFQSRSTGPIPLEYLPRLKMSPSKTRNTCCA